MRDGPDSDAKADWQMDAGTKAADEILLDDPPPPSTRGVLTPAEIDALLRPKPQQGALDAPVPEHIEPRKPEVFEVAPPERTPERDQHVQKLAAQLALALSSGAGMKAALSVSGQAKIARTDLAGLMQGKSSAIACLGPSETDIRALVCIPPLLADAIIAKACGARGSTGRIGDGWSLSAIDCALLQQLLTPFGKAMRDDFQLQAIETDVSYVSSLIPVQDVYVAEFAVEAPGLHSELAVIEGEAGAFEAPVAAEKTLSEAAGMTAIVTAQLATLTVPLSRLTELKAGSTLLLGLPSDQPIQLLSGGRDGKPIFEGKMGRKGNKVAVKITKRLQSF